MTCQVSSSLLFCAVTLRSLAGKMFPCLKGWNLSLCLLSGVALGGSLTVLPLWEKACPAALLGSGRFSMLHLPRDPHGRKSSGRRLYLVGCCAGPCWGGGGGPLLDLSPEFLSWWASALLSHLPALCCVGPTRMWCEALPGCPPTQHLGILSRALPEGFPREARPFHQECQLVFWS